MYYSFEEYPPIVIASDESSFIHSNRFMIGDIIVMSGFILKVIDKIFNWNTMSNKVICETLAVISSYPTEPVRTLPLIKKPEVKHEKA